jgi:hypothetical protein
MRIMPGQPLSRSSTGAASHGRSMQPQSTIQILNPLTISWCCAAAGGAAAGPADHQHHEQRRQPEQQRRAVLGAGPGRGAHRSVGSAGGGAARCMAVSDSLLTLILWNLWAPVLCSAPGTSMLLCAWLLQSLAKPSGASIGGTRCVAANRHISDGQPGLAVPSAEGMLSNLVSMP